MHEVQQQAWDEEGAVGAGAPLLDRRVQARLGRELRALYDDVVGDPLPDHIKDALQRFELAQQQQATERDAQ